MAKRPADGSGDVDSALRSVMDKKLVVAVIRLREAGKIIPRHNLAFATPVLGVLNLGEERIPALNRHALVATLRDPQTGVIVEGLPPLVDARLVRALPDEWVFTGFERVLVGMQECDCAQSWLARASELLG